MSLFSEGLIIGRNFAFQNGFGLSIKTAINTKDNNVKQLKTAKTNSPWAYIWEGLLSGGYLQLRFGGAYFWEDFFLGGGYYQNFTWYIKYVWNELDISLKRSSEMLISAIYKCFTLLACHYTTTTNNNNNNN